MRAGQKSCDRCGDRDGPFISTYWDPDVGWCVQCCFEMSRSFDADYWPENPYDLPVPAGRKVLRTGLTISGTPIPYDLSVTEF